MQQFYLRVCFILVAVFASALVIRAQETTTGPPSVDPDLLDLQTSRIPKEYTIARISVTGIHHIDTSIVLSGLGIYAGDKVMIPGSDVFAKAIQHLWRQKFFSDVQLYFTRVHNDRIWIEIYVNERPRLGNYKFFGASKPETEELQAKMQLNRQSVISDNMLGHISEVATKYYRDKGFHNVKVTTQQKGDPFFTKCAAYTSVFLIQSGCGRIRQSL